MLTVYILVFYTGRVNASERQPTQAKRGSPWAKTQYANLVRHIPSGGLYARLRVKGKLIWLHKHLTERGGRLALCCLGPMSSDLTMLTFAKLMPIRDTREEALRALDPS